MGLLKNGPLLPRVGSLYNVWVLMELSFSFCCFKKPHLIPLFLPFANCGHSTIAALINRTLRGNLKGNFWSVYLAEPGVPSSCKRPLDIGVIIDRSGSIGAANFEKAKNFVVSLVHKLPISSHGTRLGIIPYNSRAQVSVRFSDVQHQTPDAMARLIRGIPYTSGNTRTDVAIELANSQLFSSSGGDRTDKDNVLIVMTDGKTNHGSKPYKTVLAPLKVSLKRAS